MPKSLFSEEGGGIGMNCHCALALRGRKRSSGSRSSSSTSNEMGNKIMILSIYNIRMNLVRLSVSKDSTNKVCWCVYNDHEILRDRSQSSMPSLLLGWFLLPYL